jgi:7-cyano-7-deazaguanine synthase
MKKVVIGLSGGMDSATLLGYLLGQGFSVHCCSFLYGSKHSSYEMDAARDIILYYGDKGYNVTQSFIDLRPAFKFFKSNLLLSGDEIPEGHYAEESMKQTVVPGRNLIMSSIMAGIAESIGAEAIGLGVHSGDHHIYPDCRPEFIYHLQQTLNESTEGKVKVLAPFIDLDKEKILRIGYAALPNVPYHLTRTCYKNQSLSCGKCGSCRERLEAFELIGKKDPILYEKI